MQAGEGTSCFLLVWLPQAMGLFPAPQREALLGRCPPRGPHSCGTPRAGDAYNLGSEATAVCAGVGWGEKCLGQGNLREGRCPKDEGVGVTDDAAKAAGAGLLTSACVEDGRIFEGVDNGCFVREEVCPGSTALGLS